MATNEQSQDTESLLNEKMLELEKLLEYEEQLKHEAEQLQREEEQLQREAEQLKHKEEQLQREAEQLQQHEAYEVSLFNAAHCIEAGYEGILHGGGVREGAGNSFRKAGEYLLQARIEACGLKDREEEKFKDDEEFREYETVMLFKCVQKGNTFRQPKGKTPSYNDFRVFAYESHLINSEENEYYETVRDVGNASSHAGKPPTKERLMEAGSAITAVYDADREKHPSDLLRDTEDARLGVYASYLENSVKTDYLEEKVRKKRKRVLNLTKEEKEQLVDDEAALRYNEHLERKYRKRITDEFPNKASDVFENIGRDVLKPAIYVQRKDFEDRAKNLSQLAERIEKQQNYIEEHKRSLMFNRTEAADKLKNLETWYADTKIELNEIVVSLKAKTEKLNTYLGADKTRNLRKEMGWQIAPFGYSPYTFNTDVEESKRLEMERLAEEERQKRNQIIAFAAITFGVLYLMYQVV